MNFHALFSSDLGNLKICTYLYFNASNNYNLKLYRSCIHWYESIFKYTECEYKLV